MVLISSVLLAPTTGTGWLALPHAGSLSGFSLMISVTTFAERRGLKADVAFSALAPHTLHSPCSMGTLGREAVKKYGPLGTPPNN